MPSGVQLIMPSAFWAAVETSAHATASGTAAASLSALAISWSVILISAAPRVASAKAMARPTPPAPISATSPGVTAPKVSRQAAMKPV